MTEKFVSTAKDPIPVSRIDIEWLVTTNRQLWDKLRLATEANARLNKEWARQRDEIRRMRAEFVRLDIDIPDPDDA